MDVTSTYTMKNLATLISKEGFTDLDSLSDPELVQLAKAGRSRAFEELTRRHRASVSAIVFRIVRHPEDTEDSLQEAFLKAFRHLEGFDGRSKFSTWLTKIAINSALMLLRKQKCQPTHLTISLADDDDVVRSEVRYSGMTPEEEVAESEVFSQLRFAVSKLPPNLRVAMELRSEKDLSVREIARCMDISEAATKSRLLRARARVEKAMRSSQRLPPSSVSHVAVKPDIEPDKPLIRVCSEGARFAKIRLK